ncbi:MAG: hypothetical protein M0006_02655 [Magnetospirillum sp.]|nr:hypothetical protein [Magnetospirillum sp.]
MLDVRDEGGNLLGHFDIDYRGEPYVWVIRLPERGAPEITAPSQIPLPVRMWKDSSSLRPCAIAEGLSRFDLRLFPEFVPTATRG